MPEKAREYPSASGLSQIFQDACTAISTRPPAH